MVHSMLLPHITFEELSKVFASTYHSWLSVLLPSFSDRLITLEGANHRDRSRPHPVLNRNKCTLPVRTQFDVSQSQLPAAVDGHSSSSKRLLFLSPPTNDLLRSRLAWTRPSLLKSALT